MTSAPNAVLHPWLQGELAQILAALPAMTTHERARRPLLIWDNLAGHTSWPMVRWSFQRGVLPLYTPLSGAWLHLAEAVQRILVARALAGQHPRTQAELLGWLEETVAGGNRAPTPFV